MATKKKGTTEMERVLKLTKRRIAECDALVERYKKYKEGTSPQKTTIDKATQTAYHEAGHVVAKYFLTKSVHKTATIIPNDEFDGCCVGGDYKDKRFIEVITSSYENEYASPKGFIALLNYVCVCLSGGVAQKIYCGLDSLPEIDMGGDYDNINELRFHDVFPHQIDKDGYITYPALDSLIETCLHFLESLLTTIEAEIAIQAIAKALLEHGTLNRPQLKELLKAGIPEMFYEESKKCLSLSRK